MSLEVGSLVEEVISAVRTAQDFGTQPVLAAFYNKNIDKAELVDGKSTIWNGCGLATFFIIYFYGLGRFTETFTSVYMLNFK